MFRTSDIILISVMIGAAAVTYTIKHRAENTLAGIRDLDRQIRYEENTIDLLKADWSLLKQPSRLQTLTETYKDDLGLQELDPNQIGDISEIPERPLGIEDLIDGNAGDAIARDGSTADPIETGGVKP